MQANRSSTTFLGDTSIGTDEHGKFTFLNVHPDEDYFVYGMMGSFKDGGAVAAKAVRVGGEGATTDAGDLPVVRGHRIKGQVLLADGKDDPAQDPPDGEPAKMPGIQQRVELDAEGRFEISGLPTERYSLNVSLRGYRMSSKNHSVDSQDTGQLVGTIDQDIDTLKILMEPGALSGGSLVFAMTHWLVTVGVGFPA